MIYILLVLLVIAAPHAFADSFEVHTIAENLRVPWAIDFAPDGRIFFTERGGTIRIIENGQVSEPIKKFNVGSVEGGLLGIALDPDFENNHYTYVYYTYTDFLATYNKVVRFTEINNDLVDEFVLIDKIPGGPIHDGGRIKFADDHTLYITTGDAGNQGLAQDVNSLGGKILRINPDGSFPKDNPFVDSAVFSLGHRNPQGIDWSPDTGMLVSSEHGPSGEKGFAHDEINVIYGGQNYGWPEIVGGQTKDGMHTPILHSGTVTWAPSGATFYDSGEIPEFAGKFLVAMLAGNHIKAIDIENDTVKSSKEYFVGQYGRLRDVATDGHGNIYILTSNQDGRGSPAYNDDRILMLSPTDTVIYESPKRQLDAGTNANEIKCSFGKSLIFKYDTKNPACVKHDSVAKLVKLGWAFR